MSNLNVIRDLIESNIFAFKAEISSFPIYHYTPQYPVRLKEGVSFTKQTPKS